MSALLACPKCGSTEDLTTVETASIYYPATFTRDEEGIALNYPGIESYEVNDEGTDYTGMVRCRACFEVFPEAELVDSGETADV